MIDVLAALVIAVAPATDTPVPAPPATVSEPLEDEPGWDCRTMGNRRCS